MKLKLSRGEHLISHDALIKIDTKQIIVIDDYISKYFQKIIHDDLLQMEWGFTNSPYANYNSSRMFGINLYCRNEYNLKCPDSIRKFTENIFNGVLDEYSNCQLLRILANMQGLQQYAEIHTDHSDTKYVSLIYHVNESQGDTVIYENDKNTVVESISFKMGRIVIFPSHYWHQGLPPTQNINPTNNFRMSLGYCFSHD